MADPRFRQKWNDLGLGWRCTLRDSKLLRQGNFSAGGIGGVDFGPRDPPEELSRCHQGFRPSTKRCVSLDCVRPHLAMIVCRYVSAGRSVAASRAASVAYRAVVRS